MEEEFL